MDACRYKLLPLVRSLRIDLLSLTAYSKCGNMCDLIGDVHIPH